MNDDTPIQYIDTAAGLAAFCSRLSAVDWFALDTEFLREKTYYPKLCLLQIATTDEVACIDPLALDDLGPLLAVLADPRITKVMHSCRQDMEIFYQLAGRAPAPVFDTQVAAPLLGYADQIGYANLVKEIAGVALDKLHTRADWSVRPLTQAQIRYAADDVIYLVDIYRRIVARLQELGRLDWLAEDFRQLSEAGLYDMAPASAWLKVKGAHRLKGASLSILQSLAQWREETARSKDRPRGWLLRDDAMLDIARHKPDTPEALKAIRGLSDSLLNRSGEELLGIVEQAIARKPSPFPDSGYANKTVGGAGGPGRRDDGSGAHYGGREPAEPECAGRTQGPRGTAAGRSCQRRATRLASPTDRRAPAAAAGRAAESHGAGRQAGAVRREKKNGHGTTRKNAE